MAASSRIGLRRAVSDSPIRLASRSPSIMSVATSANDRSLSRTATTTEPSSRRRSVRKAPATRGGLRNAGTARPSRRAAAARPRADVVNPNELAPAIPPMVPAACDNAIAAPAGGRSRRHRDRSARTGHARSMSDPEGLPDNGDQQATDAAPTSPSGPVESHDASPEPAPPTQAGTADTAPASTASATASTTDDPAASTTDAPAADMTAEAAPVAASPVAASPVAAAPVAATPPPPPPPPSEPRAKTTESSAEDDLDDPDDDLDELSPWAGLAASIGAGLIAVVAVQVLLAIVEGLSLKSGQRVGVPDDMLHRLGYPFGGLGTTALFFLVVGVIVVALPSLLDEELDYGKDRLVGAMLVVTAVLAVVIALGSVLAVRANLHEYAAKQIAIPAYARVQFASFLLGSLGAAALALFGSMAARGHRAADRWED